MQAVVDELFSFRGRGGGAGSNSRRSVSGGGGVSRGKAGWGGVEIDKGGFAEGVDLVRDSSLKLTNAVVSCATCFIEAEDFSSVQGKSSVESRLCFEFEGDEGGSNASKE